MRHDDSRRSSSRESFHGSDRNPKQNEHGAGTPHRRALLLEDDPETSHVLALVLASPRLEVVPALSGAEALAVARRVHFDLLLVDLGLPDMPGLEVVRRFRAQDNLMPFIVICGRASVPAVVECMKLGALDVLEKPVTFEDLTEAVDSVLWPAGCDARVRPAPATPTEDRARSPEAIDEVDEPRSAVERWARLVVRAVHADRDARTLDLWAREVGVSRSVLCESCRIVHVTPRDARDFARLLRAARKSGERWQPETVIDFADTRTLKQLERRAGLTRLSELGELSIDEFLRCQQLIPEDHPGLPAVRRMLRDDDE